MLIPVLRKINHGRQSYLEQVGLQNKEKQLQTLNTSRNQKAYIKKKNTFTKFNTNCSKTDHSHEIQSLI